MSNNNKDFILDKNIKNINQKKKILIEDMKELNPDCLKHPLLLTNYSEKEAIDLQLKWNEQYQKKKVQLEQLEYENIKLVAGVDISFPEIKNPTWGIACATLWDFNEKKIISSTTFNGDLPFSYIPGLLGFREARLITQALINLPNVPDLILCDGHGLIHPREFGEAIHLGIALEIPSIGVAKTMFIGECDWKNIERKKGNKSPIVIDGKIKGYAICLLDDNRPVFVSPGYLTNMDLALKISMDTVLNNKQPEPLFQADQISRRMIKIYK